MYPTPYSFARDGSMKVFSNAVFHEGNFNPSSKLDKTAKASDSSLLDGLASRKYVKGDSRTYDSVVGDDGTDGWYTLFTVTDNTTTPTQCNIKTYAHASASFIASKGYASGNGSITLLHSNIGSINAGWKYIKGVRILSDGKVQVKLNGGATTDIEAQIITNGYVTNLEDTLVKETGTPTVIDSIDPIINNSFRTKSDLYSGSNKVYHEGNLTLSNYLTTGTGQTTGSNFTVKGRLSIGNTANTSGDAIVYDGSNNPTIHLDGDASGIESSTGTKIHLQGNGNATFKETITTKNLTATTGATIPTLTTTTINGVVEKNFTKNQSIADNTGWGVVSGLDTVAYGGELHVDPGFGYTKSGRRVEITTRTKINMTPAASNGTRYDVAYIKGPSASTEEGQFGYFEGVSGQSAATTLANGALSDAVILSTIKRDQNQASIVQGDIDNNVRDSGTITGRKPFYIEDSSKNAKVRYELHANKIKENGKYLDTIYATLNGGNTFTSNQKINGRVHISTSGTLGGSPTSGNYGFRVGNDSQYIAMDDNEILGTGELYLGASAQLYLRGSKIRIEDKIEAPENAKTVTVPAGQTSVTWTHNYGSTSYAVNLTTNSFERHIRWTNKTSNSFTIEIDDPSSQDILVDCILIGY